MSDESTMPLPAFMYERRDPPYAGDESREDPPSREQVLYELGQRRIEDDDRG